MFPPLLGAAIESASAISLIAAALFGAFLGVERSLAGKHAGMRTYALVSLGSCLFVIIGTLSSLQLSIFPGINPLQIAASIVIGIGFIGAGLSSMRGDHAELTTASGIWVASGVGMACGFGFYLLAFAATAISLIVFSVFAKLERALRVRYGKESE
ncbi:MgtC/SapB family protein [Acetobacteraceae bacterium]|nr:MgtC/SapB family protein [Candidatus Parcubacteria bacterium]